MKCGFLGCPKQAVKSLLSRYGRFPWNGCEDHYEAMKDALFMGQSGQSSGTAEVFVTDLVQDEHYVEELEHEEIL